MRNFYRTELAHTLFTLFLLFKQLLFTRYIAAVAFSEHVLRICLSSVSSRYYLAAHGYLNGNFKHLARDIVLKLLGYSARSRICLFGVNNKREGVYHIAVQKNVELYKA